MPGFYTHYLCGHETFDVVSNPEIKNIIAGHRQLYNLGAQGPDIFFYYLSWSSDESKSVNKTGGRMHAQGVSRFFSHALKYIAEKDPSERDALTSYLLGYACHYSLDCHTHPYIFYKTGFVRKDEKFTPKYTYYHRLFETTVDFLLVSEKLKCRPSGINGSNLIHLNRSESYAVGDMYRAVLKDVLGVEMNTKQIQRAIKEMGITISLLRDRTGLKKKLLSAIESGLGMYHLMSSMIHPLKLTDKLDYLNKQKSVWSLPWDRESISDSSFDEMFSNAVSEAAHMYEVIYSFITGNIPIEKALDIIGNHSFSTGLDCDKDLEFRHFDCIFE